MIVQWKNPWAESSQVYKLKQQLNSEVTTAEIFTRTTCEKQKPSILRTLRGKLGLCRIRNQRANVNINNLAS